mmetsp:Transcript_12477/g.19642  ORF Transcript_12477/g.19642 Transcript_12477/m.19642 type:complete len:542 (-) Transcript_12477:30-1655(-)
MFGFRSSGSARGLLFSLFFSLLRCSVPFSANLSPSGALGVWPELTKEALSCSYKHGAFGVLQRPSCAPERSGGRGLQHAGLRMQLKSQELGFEGGGEGAGASRPRQEAGLGIGSYRSALDSMARTSAVLAISASCWLSCVAPAEASALLPFPTDHHIKMEQVAMRSEHSKIRCDLRNYMVGAAKLQEFKAREPTDAEVIRAATSVEEKANSYDSMEELMPMAPHRSVNELTMMENMGLALVASGVSTLFMHPIDTIKCRMQVRKGAKGWTEAEIVKPRGEHTLQGNVMMLHHQLSSLYSGVGANIVREGPCNALYVAVYEVTKRTMFRSPATTAAATAWPMLAFLMAGAIGDFAGCVVAMPGEIVKRKLQTGVCKDCSQALADAVSTSAARASTMGFTSALLVRDIPEGALQMALYEQWRLTVTPLLPFMDAIAVDTLLGAVAGSIAAAVTTPVDVVLTRLTTLPSGQHSQEQLDLVENMKQILKEEGWAGLWRGTGHRAAYYGPLIGLFFGCYSWLQHLAVDQAQVSVILHSIGKGIGVN